MGAACTKPVVGDLIRPFIPPPVSKLNLDGGEVNRIISEQTKTDNIILWDSHYDTIEYGDVKKFLLSNINATYVVDRCDCDDFSVHLTSRFREHAYGMTSSTGLKGGPLFGILTGDLKLKAGDADRPHAVCFFIDSQKQLYIVDGMYNDILTLTPSMTVWNVIV